MPNIRMKMVDMELLLLIPQQVLKVGRSLQKPVDQVFSDYAERVIEFERIASWNEKEENKAVYRITKDIIPTKEDWIGLFKENFSSLDDYITYEYVSKCASPCEETKGSSPKCQPKLQRPLKYEVTFSELPSRCKGNYCLVYFSQSEDKVISVLGISDPFPIATADVD
ncbi:hypothetical protein NQ315_002092 [Exocentrus adspersus]|uniref:SKICH domain-containing protein n=1 Tax=Exocentrus adspersus TaxID=1586481 RepID=A0AAV8V696_9CUCU|nr:hypothetical protein NQ315_002092 [Exocentrus adspersus]